MSESSQKRNVFFATFAATSMIAAQISGKAARDAFFLKNFDVTNIPNMLVASAIISLFFVFVVTRLLSHSGPRKIIPTTFILSGLLFVLENYFIKEFPKEVSILMYLHIATFGAILVSGFWSIINESFDPHSAKKFIAYISGGATAGGLIGGVITERLGAMGHMNLILPLLSGFHLFCGILLAFICVKSTSDKSDSNEFNPNKFTVEATWKDYLKVFNSSYLRNLSLLVLFLTAAGTLMDYLLKTYATANYEKGDELLHFFALFYTSVGFLTLICQLTITQRFLDRFGNNGAVATAPVSLMMGGLTLLMAPQLLVAIFAKGFESVLKNSIYRSGYELLYTPVNKDEKRNGKLLIDVGVDKFADAIGGLLISFILFVVASKYSNNAIAALVVVLSACAFFIARILHKGYVKQLEKNLGEQAQSINPRQRSLTNASRILETVGEMTIDLSQYLNLSQEDSPQQQPEAKELRKLSETQKNSQKKTTTALSTPLPKQETDPLVTRDKEKLVHFLKTLKGQTLKTKQVPQLIDLLAWDEVYKEVISLLHSSPTKFEGQLIDHLLDQNEDFAIRRRIPRVLKKKPSRLSTFGLIEALKDQRFEVRYQSASALQHIKTEYSENDFKTLFDKNAIFSAVLSELQLDEKIWKNQKILDLEESEVSEPRLEFSKDVRSYIQKRAGLGLNYIFKLFSLVFPEKPLLVAYYGIFTSDPMLKGTSMEYLESILPEDIQEKLWPLIKYKEPEQKEVEKQGNACDQTILETQKSIQLNLEELEKQLKA